MPKVTVLMSVYDGKQFLAEAIDSILGQTFADFEFLIADDGSTDGSGKLLDDLAAKDTRVRVIHQGNSGLTKTLNRLIRQAQGGYIARMDADDISLPERLAKEVGYLDAHPDVAVVSTFAKVIDGEGNIIGEHRPGVTHEEIKKLSFFSGQLCHPAVMFRKEAIEDLGGYDETYRYAQDAALWFRVMKKYQVANLPEFLFLWRRTSAGIGVAKKKAQDSFVRRARLAAIRAGLYPSYYVVYLLWPKIRTFVPAGFKEKIKKLFIT